MDGNTLPGDLIPFTQLGELLPCHPTKQTLHRWQRFGVGGVRLRTFKLGRTRYVSEADLVAFARQLGGGESASVMVETPRARNLRREKQIAAARKVLDEAGI